MSRIVFAGNINVDSVKLLSAWPSNGMLVSVSGVKRSVGGSVSNTGIDLKTLDSDVEVAAFGKVGADEPGRFARDFLSSRGLDVSGVRMVADAPTAAVDCLTLESTGERTFLFARGAGALLSPEDFDVGALRCDLFHLGYLLLLDGLDAADPEYGTKAARLLAKVQAAGIRTSIDVVSLQTDRFKEVVRPALKYCDYAVLNEIEASAATGIAASDMRGMSESLKSLGVRDTVVIHRPEGSAALDAAGRYVEVGSLELPQGWIVGATGAGDAFCAGMLYSFLKGMDAEAGMRLASCAAACNLSVADSVSGARSLAETLALEGKFKRRNPCWST